MSWLRQIFCNRVGWKGVFLLCLGVFALLYTLGFDLTVRIPTLPPSNCSAFHLTESEQLLTLKSGSWRRRGAPVLLLDEGIHPHLEDVMLASVVPQHILLVLAKVTAFGVRTSIGPGRRHHGIDPLLEVELGQMVLLLPVLVLRVRHKAADLALVPTHTHTRLLELFVHLLNMLADEKVF